jgi:hypothetical protein
LRFQGVYSAYTPESQAAYTPESQAKLYAGITGQLGVYTPESQAKLYAGITGETPDALQHQHLKINFQKTIRRNHRQNYTPESQVNGAFIRRNHRQNYTPESQVKGSKSYAGVTGVYKVLLQLGAIRSKLQR